MRALAVCTILFAFACGGEDDPDPYEGPPIACEGSPAKAREALKTYCSRCHSPDNPSGGFGVALDSQKLVEKGKVVPGDAASSPIYRRAKNGTMPPATVEPRPSAEDIEVLRTWIDCGAENF